MSAPGTRPLSPLSQALGQAGGVPYPELGTLSQATVCLPSLETLRLPLPLLGIGRDRGA